MLSFHLQKIQVIRKWQVLDPSLDSNLKIVEFYKILKRTIKINPQRCNLQSEFLTQYYKDTKGQGMILDVVKDHLIPHIIEKAKAKDMCDALVGIFQSDNMTNKI